MDEKQSHIVDRLMRFLVDHYAPEMIILYGSTARGDTDEFSDIDMMVIMDVQEGDKVSAEILAGTDHIVHDKHIFVRSVTDFITLRDIPGTMVFSALSEGLVIYRKPGFVTDVPPRNGYEERKKGVIRTEYLAQVRVFLEKAELSLDGGQLFRCRDYLRFAAVRTLKAVMVLKDVHPPGSTDLEMLSGKTRELFPEVERLQPLIEDLNNYCPVNSSTEEIIKCRGIADKVHFVVESIASFIQ